MQNPDPSDRRRSKRGPAPLPPAERREHCVSVRLNTGELADLDAARTQVGMQRGEYLRASWAGELPQMVPRVNMLAWQQLARLAANLNQYQAQLNAGLAHGHPPELIESLADEVQKLRLELLGGAPK